MAKDYWSVKLSSNECRSKVPYSGYVSCQHWENKKKVGNGPPVICCKEKCPILIEDKEDV